MADSYEEALETGVFERLKITVKEDNIRCLVCDVILTGKVPATQHLAGKSHAKKANRTLDAYISHNQDKLESLKAEGVLTISEVHGCTFLYCNLCSKSMTGEMPAIQHINGAKHLRSYRERKSFLSTSSLQSTSSQDNSFSTTSLHNQSNDASVSVTDTSIREMSISSPKSLDNMLSVREMAISTPKSSDNLPSVREMAISTPKSSDNLPSVREMAISTPKSLDNLLELESFERALLTGEIVNCDSSNYFCVLCNVNFAGISEVKLHVLTPQHVKNVDEPCSTPQHSSSFASQLSISDGYDGDNGR